MRKITCALMMTLLLLSGCSIEGQGTARSAQELALNIRTEYLSMKACDACVDISADYGQRVYEYTMQMSWEKGGETLLTVTAPENIAGITARIGDGVSYLEYDGVSLETGPISLDGISPIEVVPAVLNYIISGYIAECDFESIGEKQTLWFCCRDPEIEAGKGIEAMFWFDAESHDIMRAEIISEGSRVITCEFTEFTKE